MTAQRTSSQLLLAELASYGVSPEAVLIETWAPPAEGMCEFCNPPGRPINLDVDPERDRPDVELHWSEPGGPSHTMRLNSRHVAAFIAAWLNGTTDGPITIRLPETARRKTTAAADPAARRIIVLAPSDANINDLLEVVAAAAHGWVDRQNPPLRHDVGVFLATPDGPG